MIGINIELISMFGANIERNVARLVESVCSEMFQSACGLICLHHTETAVHSGNTFEFSETFLS